jgi:predicted  nucleic acid-binding Zn-ribbon protein
LEIENVLMRPEILHRCASCGASIRDAAMFCPECGKPLAPVSPTEPTANAPQDELHPANAETPGRVAPSSTERVESSEGPLGGSSVKSAFAPENVKTNPINRRNQTDHPAEPGARPGTRERTRERLHRASSVASSVARGALGDNVKRVEKIHDFSTAMLEEAHYDPSLRFVLVALGLFIVFVILLILSKVMG